MYPVTFYEEAETQDDLEISITLYHEDDIVRTLDIGI